MKRPLRSAPIFVQVFALVVLSLVAAQVINLIVVLSLPDPPAPGFSVQEAARALRGEVVRTHDGKRLIARSAEAEPAWLHAGEGLNGVITQVLAKELAVAPDQVRVSLRAPKVEVERHVSAVQMHLGHMRRSETTFVTVRAGPGRGDGPPDPLAMTRRAMPGPEGMQILSDNLVFPPFAAAMRAPDGRWQVVEPSRPLINPWQTRTLIWFALSALLLAPVAWLVARRLARPIHAFAEAAERLGRDPQAPPLPYEGPQEVRTAVAAFNDMQEKLRSYVEARTAMVGAIAHDLRTPLFRLRFRVENAPEEIRAKAAADIDQMDAMISAALAFVRGEGSPAERVRLDLSALAQSVVADLADMGVDAACEAEAPVLVQADALALKRLAANLVDNAVKFAGAARVSVTRDGADALLVVEDDGPGVAAAEMERVFEPFYRADAARTSGGGFGLGLSTARSIAQAHGGEVTLENRPGGGLRATLRLPAV